MVIQVAAGALTGDSGRLRSGRLLYFAAVQPQLTDPVGTGAVRAPAWAASQRPSVLARSPSASPASCIRPCAIRAATLSRLILDHLLFGLRGVNRCSQYWSSNLPFCPSIQP